MNGVIPTDPVQAMLAQTALNRTLFSAASRYFGLDTETLERPDGTLVVYLKRRFLPQPERFVEIQTHTVLQGERLDNIAAQYLGDATLFWRIADANRALCPEALTERVGRTLSITLPEGISGSPL